jgi:hypothetical protein
MTPDTLGWEELHSVNVEMLRLGDRVDWLEQRLAEIDGSLANQIRLCQWHDDGGWLPL